MEFIMELIKKGLLLITLVAVMGTTKTEQSTAEKLAAKKLERIEQQEKQEQEWQKEREKEQIEREVLKKQQEEQTKRKIEEKLNALEWETKSALSQIQTANQVISNLNQRIQENNEGAKAAVTLLAGLSLFTFVCFLSHIGFKIDFAQHTV